MTADDVFPRLIGALENAQIPYMLTGSFASAYYGTARATQDIDVVIAPTVDQLRALVRLLPPDEYYIDEGAALDAQRRRSQFNIIDLATGWKIDLIVRRERPYSLEEFGRRRDVDFAGRRLMIATAEDVAIAKLEWAKLGESQRQIEDVAGILRLRATDLDMPYIETWVSELGLQEPWSAALRAAGR
jgi:hypothetical protein